MLLLHVKISIVLYFSDITKCLKPNYEPNLPVIKMVKLKCPWSGCIHERPDLEQEQVALDMIEMNQAAARQSRRKAHRAVGDEGVVTDNYLDMFQQQLMSYKRLAGLTSTTADAILHGLPPQLTSSCAPDMCQT